MSALISARDPPTPRWDRENRAAGINPLNKSPDQRRGLPGRGGGGGVLGVGTSRDGQADAPLSVKTPPRPEAC